MRNRIVLAPLVEMLVVIVILLMGSVMVAFKPLVVMGSTIQKCIIPLQWKDTFSL